MKKKLLFVIDSLDTAGAEKSLVTLLSMLDYSRYSVDLQLFAHGYPLEELVPEEVTILKPLKYTNFVKKTLKEALKYAITKRKFKMLASRLKYSTRIRKKKYSNPQKAIIYWQSVSSVIETNPKVYDVAISYAQGVPTYYVAEKVKARKKFAWVNVSYRLNEMEKGFQKGFYDQYEKIVAVSDSTKETLLESFPNYENKINIIYDVNNPKFISSMASIGNSYKDSFDGLRILTVGRLANQKGYDLALKACLRLKEKGINFRWYVLGKGPLKNEIEELIEKFDLAGHFILLGVEANPYSFFKNTDIYVQTSKFEGFGLAIAEARMLNIPVVTTRFDAVYNQMIHGKNGLVVDMNAEAICDGILKLINDHELKQSIIDYLHNEKKGNIEEISKFYQLIG
ncbi:glycosyltransferase [Oceanobacillus halophilus]|uniref:Glycosyltransferase n=1 Tax=Oceanobacillus halophilus TaxID=930130 RepID=A0A495A3F6_9BACI|nr:glycosyltransferase [Oceanobacillus halophilus]RKQ33488.1 glycosyltransferase [Oceanobacillus halophilus]